MSSIFITNFLILHKTQNNRLVEKKDYLKNPNVVTHQLILELNQNVTSNLPLTLLWFLKKIEFINGPSTCLLKLKMKQVQKKKICPNVPWSIVKVSSKLVYAEREPKLVPVLKGEGRILIRYRVKLAHTLQWCTVDTLLSWLKFLTNKQL